MRARCWKARTAACVFGPKMPSHFREGCAARTMFRTSCSFFTSDPADPSLRILIWVRPLSDFEGSNNSSVGRGHRDHQGWPLGPNRKWDIKAHKDEVPADGAK